MTDLPERLRHLAESLEGDDWEHPITARDDCLRAADEIERLRHEAKCWRLIRVHGPNWTDNDVLDALLRKLDTAERGE